MALTPEQIEWLHDNGKMPDWAYYQQNGKSPMMNWEAQTRKFKNEALANYDRIQEARRKEAEKKKEQAEAKKQEAELTKKIEKQIGDAVEKALADILKSLSK